MGVGVVVRVGSVVVVVWVPVTKVVHVIGGMHGRPFVGHGHLPELGEHGGAGRGNRRGAVEMLPFRHTAVLHDLLVLGALVLEPDLYLQNKRRRFWLGLKRPAGTRTQAL